MMDCAMHIAMVGVALLLAAPAHACEGSSCPARGKGSDSAMTNVTPPPEVLWSHPIARFEVPPRRVVVSGLREAGRFLPSSAFVPDVEDDLSAGRAPFPLETNLTTMLDFRVFGAEERATVSRDRDALIFRCVSGERPAGLVLSTRDLRYPRGLRGDLLVEGQSASKFTFALSAAGGDAAEVSWPKTPLARGILATISSGEWHEVDGGLELVVSCPLKAATATISGIRLIPDGRRTSAGIGTWLWDARPWLGDPRGLAAEAARHSIKDIFLQIRIVDGQVADAGGLKRLIDIVSAAGVAVHAVEGDAEMATPAGRLHALTRALAIRDFMDAGATLNSVQYDIEPYLRADHAADPDAGWNEWAVTINDLSDVFTGKVSIVVPFWMLDNPAGKLALRSVTGSISGVAVMAYRTDVAQVERIAEGWLAWGGERGVPVSIALENGPIPTEFQRTFVRAENGNLLVDRSKDVHAVVMLSGSVSDSYTKPAFSFSHEIEVDPLRISFLDDRSKLTATRGRLERTLSAWGSFDRLMVHGLITPGG